MHCVNFSYKMCQDFCSKYPEFSLKDKYYIKYKNTTLKLLVNDFEWPGKGLHLVVEFVDPKPANVSILLKRFILGNYERSYIHFDSVNEWVVNNYDSYIAKTKEAELASTKSVTYNSEINSVLNDLLPPCRFDGQNLSIKIGKNNLNVAKTIAKALDPNCVSITRKELTDKFIQTYCNDNHSHKQFDAQFGIDLINAIFGVEK